MNYCRFRFIGQHPHSEATAFITEAYEDAYKRFIGPAIERELRGVLTADAEAKSIKVFGQNLYNLLMQAPIKAKLCWGSTRRTGLVAS